MSGSRDGLIAMANQIARFFESQGPEPGVEGVADHVAAFWDPAMRATLYAHLDAGGAGLSPLAKAGLERLRARPAREIRTRLQRAGGG